MTEQPTNHFKLLYPAAMALLEKIETIAKKIYGTSHAELSLEAQAAFVELEKNYSHYPVCIAKTQYSFSSDAKIRDAPRAHVLKYVN
jgi:formate--tetrahydrofolate ligase